MTTKSTLCHLAMLAGLGVPQFRVVTVARPGRPQMFRCCVSVRRPHARGTELLELCATYPTHEGAIEAAARMALPMLRRWTGR